MGLSNAETVTRKARRMNTSSIHAQSGCPTVATTNVGWGQLIQTESGPSRQTRHFLVTVVSAAGNVDREWTFPFKDCGLESCHKEPGGVLLRPAGKHWHEPLQASGKRRTILPSVH